ncbi:MAG: MBL fold metallo-hydrolase [Lachnospiraceae bacterium]|nr:MBL fold metallo-hydrolase [Lachnospiraceae bacterium]
MKQLSKSHKLVRAVVVLIIIIMGIVVAVFTFLKLWPAFGGKASKEDKKDYARRAENYHDDRFFNDGDFQIQHKAEKNDDRIMSTKATEPKAKLPVKPSSYDLNLEENNVQITWFGHSSLLLQMHGMNILIDPMFSERISPVSFAGPKRFSDAPVKISELPHIDILVISHDHYDHLDYQLIKEIDEKTDRYIVPLGVENHLERWGVEKGKIRNMAWWEEITIDGLTIGCTPARHYSGRSLDDQFATLWASWVFKDEYYQIFESGDTGYGEHFQKIYEKYGNFDFVMIDCAQYDMNWPEVHMFPEEAVQAVKMLGAKTAMPIHWAAMSLANHAWDDSAERFVYDGENNGLNIVTPYLGETMSLEMTEDYQERWWKDIE